MVLVKWVALCASSVHHLLHPDLDCMNDIHHEDFEMLISIENGDIWSSGLCDSYLLVSVFHSPVFLQGTVVHQRVCSNVVRSQVPLQPEAPAREGCHHRPSYGIVKEKVAALWGMLHFHCAHDVSEKVLIHICRYLFHPWRKQEGFSSARFGYLHFLYIVASALQNLLRQDTINPAAAYYALQATLIYGHWLACQALQMCVFLGVLSFMNQTYSGFDYHIGSTFGLLIILQWNVFNWHFWIEPKAFVWWGIPFCVVLRWSLCCCL